MLSWPHFSWATWYIFLFCVSFLCVCSQYMDPRGLIQINACMYVNGDAAVSHVLVLSCIFRSCVFQLTHLSTGSRDIDKAAKVGRNKTYTQQTDATRRCAPTEL